MVYFSTNVLKRVNRMPNFYVFSILKLSKSSLGSIRKISEWWRSGGRVLLREPDHPFIEFPRSLHVETIVRALRNEFPVQGSGIVS